MHLIYGLSSCESLIAQRLHHFKVEIMPELTFGNIEVDALAAASVFQLREQIVEAWT